MTGPIKVLDHYTPDQLIEVFLGTGSVTACGYTHCRGCSYPAVVMVGSRGDKLKAGSSANAVGRVFRPGHDHDVEVVVSRTDELEGRMWT